MAKDMSDTVREALGQVVREAVKNVGNASPQQKKPSPLSGARGVAAGAGLAALAPLAKKGVDAVRGNGLHVPSPKPGKVAAKATSKAAKKMGDQVGGKLKEGVSEKVDEAGGAGGLVKEAASGLLPGGGDSGGGKGGMPGVGKGRRMPVQQSVDVAVPVETAYNQWTQFEDWPEFMHRVTRVTQEDDCTVSFATKIWGKTKEFVAEIETQRPDERIKWKVTQGITHTGVVTFHELAPRLTRVELNVDVDPGSLLEKAARGMRHIKRAMRADLHRFKAFVEMQELETGAWRGVIEDGEVVDDHDESYDEERDYSEVDDLYDEYGEGEDRDEEDDEDDEESQRSRSQRFKRQAERSSSRSGGGSRSRSGSSSGGSKSKSSSSGSRSKSSSGSSRSKSSSSGNSRSRSSGRSQSRSRGSSNGGNRSGSSSKSSGGRRKTSSRS
jgi:uncharacterized membrane protein